MFRQTINRLSAGHYNNKGTAGDTQQQEMYEMYRIIEKDGRDLKPL